ncbi:MAG TPA: hypothetical protein VK713_07580, partial [Actinomycetes bacterium]|nr:hypothetical protein [Actinomycetes bacterium]
MALGDDPLTEVNLGVDAQTADNARDGVPRHIHELTAVLARAALALRRRHCAASFGMFADLPGAGGA